MAGDGFAVQTPFRKVKKTSYVKLHMHRSRAKRVPSKMTVLPEETYWALPHENGEMPAIRLVMGKKEEGLKQK